MKKRYHKTGTVILSIFILAVICVAAIVFFIFQSGLRYMKTEQTNIKYFGRAHPDGHITDGRMWFEDTVASVRLQRYYIVDIFDESLNEILNIKNFTPYDDVLKIINETLPDYMTDSFALNNFIFNTEYDPVFLHSEVFSDVIRNYERAKNNIISGEIYTADGTVWTLVSTKANPSSYNDFEVIPGGDKLKAHKGDIINFMESAYIRFASFNLSDGNILYLYPAHNIYRIEYDRGVDAGDLYIGPITDNLEKDGRGFYFYTTGNIYYGDFIRNEKSGSCMILFDNGDTYAGGIIDGKKEGYAVFKWVDGSEYSGEFRNNMNNGRGLYLYENGEYYDGEWLDGVKHGTGKLVFAGGDTYEGEFASDIFTGRGRYTWASGEFYEGSFMHNAMHGRGKYHWITGRSFDGWFSFGEMVLNPPDDVPHNERRRENNNEDDDDDLY